MFSALNAAQDACSSYRTVSHNIIRVLLTITTLHTTASHHTELHDKVTAEAPALLALVEMHPLMPAASKVDQQLLLC